ncbi:MAG TPA: prolyl oligopeptidase family serine peptidase [Candidatus Sulfopaludibacter sp.]|nr:prolyl oligopeptidase family serine peptidase [Candidatus Sulfopaludibacter sp.]
MPRRLYLLVLWALLASPFVHGAEVDGLPEMSFTVNGAARTALIYVPPAAKTSLTPLVFVFHGHGGSAQGVAHSFHLEREWPEALVVYPQGLPTPGPLTDLQGKQAGWQAALGDQGDRDLKFFDTVLARLKQDYHVDAKRIYCTGHSNGGGFTYLLWLARGDVFAAVAPSSAAARYANKLPPRPALILGGQNDPLVKFSWQERTMEAVRKVNGCSSTGQPWDKQCTIYPSKEGTPLVAAIFPGGHQFNPAAPALIVEFFKEHPGPTAEQAGK